MFAQKTARPFGKTIPPGGPDAHQLRCGSAGFIANVRLSGGENVIPSSVELVDHASMLFTENTSSTRGLEPLLVNTRGAGLPVALP